MEWENEDGEQLKLGLEEGVVQDQRENCQDEQRQETELKDSYGAATKYLRRAEASSTESEGAKAAEYI